MQKIEQCQSLFIRELEGVLNRHGSEIGYDLVSRVGLHPEKVSRLKDSLEGKKGFHLLNPEELDRLYVAFDVAGEEQLRLQAAILATAITQTLVGRIDEANALLAGEEVFPLMLAALHQRLSRKTGLGATRKKPVDGTNEEDRNKEQKNDLMPILAELDQAMSALYISQIAFAPQERLRQAQQAREHLVAVIQALDDLGDEQREKIGREIWQMWREEAQHQLIPVLDILRDFGENV